MKNVRPVVTSLQKFSVVQKNLGEEFFLRKNVGGDFVRIFIKKLYLSPNPATMAEL